MSEKLPANIGQTLIGIALLIVMGLSGWTLSTAQELSKTAAVQKVEIAYIKEDILALTANLQSDLEMRYLQAAGERLESQFEDLRLRLARVWNAVRKLEGGSDIRTTDPR